MLSTPSDIDQFIQKTTHIETLLFDLDGTLVETDDDAVDALAERLRPMAGQRATRMARWLLMQIETPGNAAITVLDRVGIDQWVRDRLHQIRRPRPHKQWTLVAGAEQLLPQLATSYKLGLVTTRERQDIDRFLAQETELAALFGVTCGSQDTPRLKPHPQPIVYSAEALHTPPARCLMIGDTTVDIHAGRRAGALTVGVCSGFGTARELGRAGADLVLPSVQDLTFLVQ